MSMDVMMARCPKKSHAPKLPATRSFLGDQPQGSPVSLMKNAMRCSETDPMKEMLLDTRSEIHRASKIRESFEMAGEKEQEKEQEEERDERGIS